MLCDFAAKLPALMKDGVPLSWRHYVYGCAYLGRERAREALRTAGAVGIAQSIDPAERRNWFERQRLTGGW